MFEIGTLLIVIPGLPLAATLLTALLGKRVLRGRSHVPAVTAIALSCVASVALVVQVGREIRQTERRGETAKQVGYEQVVTLWTWAEVQRAYQLVRTAPPPAAYPPESAPRDFRIDVTLRADPLTAVMLVMVTFVSLLVAVYSIGYMQGDPGYGRFFTYIPLFVFSMTMLVSVSNFVLLYVFWEAVGLCSYLLIGFWFEKPAAATAAKKAFLVNRVGDFGFALAVFLIWTSFGTLSFHDSADGTFGVLGQTLLDRPELYQLYMPGGVATAICLLLLLGACGKSAQFPLHVWLPDAVEGPTPVSALIHAATMVTAGVYLVARCTPLFVASPDAQCVVAAVGGFTALLAALIALTQTDLKRILAYSTISQLGTMFLGLGTGTGLGIVAGTYHLFTFSLFMALLFLGAGSVMHAMGGVIDVGRLGGLKRRMPLSRWTFLVGCLALAGVPPLSGFFSNGAILEAVHYRATVGQAGLLFRVLYDAAVLTAFLTALYAFRAYFLTFHGRQRIAPQGGHRAGEPPRVMTVPLVVLAIGSAIVGGLFYLAASWGPRYGFAGFLAATPSLAYAGPEDYQPVLDWQIAGTSTAIALAGIGLAAILYTGKRTLVEGLARVMEAFGLYRLSHGKFFFDEIYALLVVRPLQGLARLSDWIDRAVIDGLVNVCGQVPGLIGAALRGLQNGLIQFYALAMVLGLLVLIGALLM